MSVYILVSSGLRNSIPFSDSNTPAKRIFARVIIFDTSAVWRVFPLGCRIISTKSPCRAVFKCLASISGSSPLFFSFFYASRQNEAELKNFKSVVKKVNQGLLFYLSRSYFLLLFLVLSQYFS